MSKLAFFARAEEEASKKNLCPSLTPQFMGLVTAVPNSLSYWTRTVHSNTSCSKQARVTQAAATGNRLLLSPSWCSGLQVLYSDTPSSDR